MGEPEKKTHLLTLMRLYAGSRDVDSLAGSLDLLLEGPIQRRLIPAVRWVWFCEVGVVYVRVNFRQGLPPAEASCQV